MRERILRGWNLQRVLFLVMGGLLITQALAEREWLSLVLGGYFAAMALFAFGCASGQCRNGNK